MNMERRLLLESFFVGVSGMCKEAEVELLDSSRRGDSKEGDGALSWPSVMLPKIKLWTSSVDQGFVSITSLHKVSKHKTRIF